MVYQMNYELLGQAEGRLSAETAKLYDKLYEVAYNSALQWYGEEAKAHRIAWSAVRSQAASLNSVIRTQQIHRSRQLA
ncbi:MAG: hypothetical protein RLZZ511_3993 [Cyanobacteriota bacterium]|jgi:cation transport regulator